MFKLRQYLEYQADRVEALLAAHHVPVRITGGLVEPERVCFHLDPAPNVGYSDLVVLTANLTRFLHTSHLALRQNARGIVLEFIPGVRPSGRLPDAQTPIRALPDTIGHPDGVHEEKRRSLPDNAYG